jgi:general secretion pathway protein G
MQQHSSAPHGFTLIELMVVMVLIALLLTIAVPRYFGVIDGGKIKVQHQNQAVMRDAIDKYYGDQGRYPDMLDDLVRKHYLREIPMDPVTQARDWIPVPPREGGLGAVYDVMPTKPNVPSKPSVPADVAVSAP